MKIALATATTTARLGREEGGGWVGKGGIAMRVYRHRVSTRNREEGGDKGILVQF